MWRVIPGQSLAFREWDGEAVLYNDLSGSTHLLDGGAIEVLQALLPGPADAATLAASLAGRFDADPAALSAMIDDTLAALASFDLVECLSC